MWDDTVFALLVAPLAYVIILPVSLVVYILNTICRTVIQTIAWWNEQGLVTLVEDGMDAVWGLKIEGKSPMVLVAIVTDHNTSELAETAYLFEKHVLLYEDTRSNAGLIGVTGSTTETYRPYRKFEKIFTSYMGYAAWKIDEKFSITKHFKETPFKERVYKEQDVLELLSDLSAKMDSSKPQWEVIRVPNYENEIGQRRSIMIFRFHHAYLDGLSILMMLTKTKICENAKLSLDPTRVKIETWKKIVHYFSAAFLAPYHFINILISRENRIFWHGPSAKCLTPGKKFYGATKPVKMDVFKSIKERTSATIPNVVALAFAAAAKRVIPSHRMVSKLRWGEITAMLPYKTTDPHNGFTLFSYDLDSQLKVQTPEQVRDTVSKLRQNRQQGLAGPEPLLIHHVFNFVGRLPQFVLPFFMGGVYNSVIMSNVPSFVEKIKLFQSPVHEFNPWPPVINDTGIIMACVSYNQSVGITAVAESSWMTSDELNKLCKEMNAVIYEMASKGTITLDADSKSSTFASQEDAVCDPISDEEPLETDSLHSVTGSDIDESEI